jgi:ABC-type branched-subunit amino acid transport system substrate-binding protein
VSKIFILFIMICFIFSQHSEEFKSAVSAYNNKDYSLAINKFSRLLNSNEKEAAYVMLMVSHYNNREFRKVKSTFSDLMKVSPKNEYLDDAYYIIGKTSFQTQDYSSALKNWFLALDISSDRDLRLKLGDLLIKSIDNRAITKPEDILLYQKQFAGERSQALLTFKAADFEETNNRLANAKYILNEFIKNFPESSYAKRAKERSDDLEEKISNEINFGVLLPFEGMPEVSEAIFKGIEFAAKKYASKLGQTINLVKADCGNSVLQAINATEKLADDQSISGIFGPLGRDQSAAVALISKNKSIPIFTPTAAQSGLTNISEYLFQLSPDNETIGKYIAEYVFGTLNMRSFAVLSSSEGKSYEIAKGFVETAELLGAEIVDHQIYYPNFNSLRAQFELIHRKAIKKEFRDSLENEIPDISSQVIDSLYKVRLDQAIEQTIQTGKEIDSNKIIVNSIDGFFFPINNNDHSSIITMITNSYIQTKFNTQLFGNNDWIDEAKFKNIHIAKSLDSMYIFTPFYIDQNSSSYKNFMNLFRVKENVTPEHFHILGYRTADFVFSTLSKENNDRESIYKKLSNEDSFISVGGEINFNYKPRVNSGKRILQLLNGNLRIVE